MDVEVLSRIQFAMTIMFHYLFPPLSIGLGLLMVLMEGLYLKTGDRQYHVMTKFWSRIFAANFAMGVATGIVMEFQFGTNWANYARFVGDVFGSALAAEGIFAFFLESGFLAVLVFGWDRVSPKMHFFATCMVSLGSIFSAVWIIIANSWMQTPAGHIIDPVQNRAVIVDFWALVFNPSSMVRLFHTLMGAFILGAFFVMSISAFYVLKNRHLDFAKKSFTIALIFGTTCSLIMMFSGDLQAREVGFHQPAKLAAFEGVFKTKPGPTGMYLFGWPDTENETVTGVEVPYLLTFLMYRDFKTPIMGLDRFRPEDRPPVKIPFMTYHLMIGLGGFFVGVTVLASFLLWRGTLFQTRWLMWVFVFAVIGAYVANQAGWVSAEVGRQPFIVYPKVVQRADGMFDMIGGMRTVDGLSNRKVVVAGQVLTSIILFTLVYILLFAVFIFVLNTKIQHGPDEPHPPKEPVPDGVPSGSTGSAGTDFLNAAATLVDRQGQTLASNEGENKKEEGR
ncbi:MAG: cytochrome ubiquinol oxidase subunit I [Planctomycetes bacterium]|nr:cytochrome ubiquinol oxidase subunit I [Planctomycetota bacterium]